MSDPVELNFERLVDWVEGRLAAQAAEAIAQQVAADQAAQATVAWIQAFRRVSGQLVLTAPPPAVRQELMQQFAEYAARQQQPTLWRRLLAALQFDSALQPVPVGMRSGGGNIARQLVYTSDDADIMLNSQARKADQRFNLFGELLPNRTDLLPEDFCAQLLQNEHEIAIAMLDDLGQFSFAGLASGEYQLILSSANVEIELDVIKI